MALPILLHGRERGGFEGLQPLQATLDELPLNTFSILGKVLNLIALSGDFITLAIIKHGYVRCSVIPNSSRVFETEFPPFRMVFVSIDPDAFARSQAIRWEGE